MDWNFLYALEAFVIGAAAGLQGIHGRYRNDLFGAASSPFGSLYLVTRGFVPAGIFGGLYATGLIQNGLWWQALVCGAGAETFLRLKVQITDEKARGPFDLLQWFQNLFLEQIAGRLAERRKELMQEELPENVSYLDLCNTVKMNLGAWPNPDERRAIEKYVNENLARFQANQVTAQDKDRLDKQHKHQLGYFILNKTGKKGLRTLLKS